MKKLIAAVALAATVTFAGSAPAIAATYPAPTTPGTVSDGTVAPGEVFTFSGTGFLAGETITITVTLTSAPTAIGGFSGGASLAAPSKITIPAATQTFTTTANSSGAFSFPVSVSQPGTYALAATGATSGKTVTASVTVAATGSGLANTGGGTGTGLANTGTGTALANTGADSSLILWSLVGAGALAAGAASVITVRRRAKATDAA
ncbi:LPXTG cell wall anchor domain-containing protein [Arthrobacter sp. M4]|uniref:LPXTG cell wall anchor domain-containing protein n=1 Tax=Arthrobacter sp. M4 TaxID=218160 RepID=UPI001CDBB4F1|nr:LPXTG cell wall anchor domain-containing protein [Arthrobacter sp. M4]MCA4133072.1 LPXTG cell wall anchor domain-containing protein [Arthrobacter sp. M4]